MRDYNPTDPIRTGPVPQTPITPPPEPSVQPPPTQAPTRPPEAATPPVQPTTQQTGQQPVQQPGQQPVQQTAGPPIQQTGPQPQPSGDGQQPIWESARADEFRQRWHEIQTHFVEDPQSTVTDARQLVDEAAQTLAENVHRREEEFARAGARTSDSTEGMRDAVLQYQHLLDRLLSV
ncbi:hypothetical protein KZZ52_24705 [Dactylosporangium sp. AC04546]|uniref:hypothetical protein n=1 Tax=Dactylosporangium sp. AC04546 TaxID=2862460 RepID=UPI001EDE9585|nr:hypothetical protein [Dactylosporangium sp. AC04546]WVK88475.1 hypothetical protein KZZ52_24705 [Dactylosporangium sp. AC04546]